MKLFYTPAKCTNLVFTDQNYGTKQQKQNYFPWLSGLLLVLYMALCNSVQAQNFEWTRTIGYSDFLDIGNSICTDASGNVYTLGGNQGSLFVQKQNASGSYVWMKTFPGASDPDPYSPSFGLALDNSGNILITGQFKGTVDFDPGAGVFNLTANGYSSMYYDVFIVKLDTSANFLWARSFGGNNHDYSYGIKVDLSGNVYTCGTFSSSVDLDPTAGTAVFTPAGYNDLFIQKLDASGNFLWVKVISGTGDEIVRSVALDAAGNVYAVGQFAGSPDFDPGPATFTAASNNGSYDCFIEKLDAAGNFVWVKTFGGISTDICQDIVVDASGYIYTTGSFSNTVDFDPGSGTTNLTSHGGIDIFVEKMDTSGNPAWVRSFGASNEDSGTDLDVSTSGSVYITGTYRSTVDFDPGTGIKNLSSITSYYEDVFILQLNSSGNYIWAGSIGGTDRDESGDIFVDASANIYTTGAFNQTSDLDPGTNTYNVTSVAGFDVFINKLSPCTDISTTETISSCGAYTWRNGITYYNSVAGVTYTAAGAVPGGCDSTYTLDLTIVSPGYSLSPASSTLSSGNSQTFTLAGSNVGVNYYLRDSITDTVIAGPVAGTGSALSFTSGALTGSQTFYVSGEKITGVYDALQLNGTNQSAHSNNMVNLSGSEITIEYWFKGTVINSPVRWQSGGDYIVAGWYSGSQYKMIMSNDGTSSGGLVIPNTVMDNSWHHIAMTWKQATTNGFNLYVDGVLSSSANSSNTPITSFSEYLYLGSYNGSSEFMNGSLDEVRIWSVARSATEIAGNMNQCLSGSEANLLTYYKFDEGSGTAIVNSAPNSSFDATIFNGAARVAGHVSCSATCITQSLNYARVNVLPCINAAQTENITACNAYTWRNGTTYTSSQIGATYTVTGAVAGGCDSTYILNLTITHSTTGTDVISDCDSHTWIDGIIYTASNSTATYTLTNVAGCDSIITLNLTIKHSTASSITVTACNSYTLNSQAYNSSGIYTQTLTNAAGCDSTLTLNLTINNSTSNSFSATACNSYTLNGQTYTSSGIYTQTLTNAAGCDSTLTLNLTINSVSDITTSASGATITATNANASYQWLDCGSNYAVLSGEMNQSFMAAANGDYAVELTENGCVDTSACVTINTVGMVRNDFGSQLIVYPNPTAGNFSIDLGNVFEAAQISVTDVVGKIIYSKTAAHARVLNLTIEEPAGVYVISIQAQDKKAIIRLLKE